MFWRVRMCVARCEFTVIFSLILHIQELALHMQVSNYDSTCICILSISICTMFTICRYWFIHLNEGRFFSPLSNFQVFFHVTKHHKNFKSTNSLSVNLRLFMLETVFFFLEKVVLHLTFCIINSNRTRLGQPWPVQHGCQC